MVRVKCEKISGLLLLIEQFHYVIPCLENTLFLCERLESSQEVFLKPIAKADRPNVSDVTVAVI